MKRQGRVQIIFGRNGRRKGGQCYEYLGLDYGRAKPITMQIAYIPFGASAPLRTYFRVPHRERMFLPEHIRQGGCWREKARVWEPQKGGCGCRNDATKMHRENGNLIAVKWTEGGNGCRNDAAKMHRENGNLIAVKWTEGEMVAAIMRQKCTEKTAT